jgi:RNA polymerase sigma-70 factor (sigma-E family)
VTPIHEAEFTEFVRTHGDALLRYARLLVPDEVEAEDVLQVALLRVLKHWPEQLRSPEAYARSVLVNLGRDRARRRHLVPVPVPESSDPTGGDLAPGPDPADAISARARLDQVLAALPPRQRVTVVLRVLEGLSEAETAAAMGCSAGTVKSNLSRGLANARAALERSPDQDPRTSRTRTSRTETEGSPR